MQAQIFVRTRRKVEKGEKKPRFRVVGVSGADLKIYTKHIRRQELDQIAAAVGRKKLVLTMPLWVMRTGATLLDWLPFYPVTRDQLTMLEEGNTASPEALQSLIARPPKAMTAEALAYLGS